jgi:hypothetical protein
VVKRKFVLAGAFMLLVIGCAGAMISIRPESEEDLLALKGQWEGSADVSESGYITSLPVSMKISSRNLDGEIMFDHSRSRVYPFVGKTSRSASVQTERVGHSKIEDGKLFVFWEDFRWAKLAFHKSNMELKGDLRWGSAVGTVLLRKEK